MVKTNLIVSKTAQTFALNHFLKNGNGGTSAGSGGGGECVECCVLC